MIDRRSFMSQSALLMLAATLPNSTFAQALGGGRLIFGVPRGSIGHSLANSALAILAKQSGLQYQLDVVDGRNTLQASETVKLAAADGTTILQSQSGSMVVFPAMYKSLNYDPLADFTPLGILGDYAYALSVGPAVPSSVNSIDTYLAWVEKNPDLRDVGFSLYGSQGHLIALMLARGKEVALRPQSYKSSNAMVKDMVSGTVAAGISVAGNVKLLGEGKLRPIAVSGSARQPAWPDVRTFAEQGLKDIVIDGWYGWFAPAKTPPAQLQALRDAINTMIASKEFAAEQQKWLINPHPLNAEQITQRMRTEIANYRKLVHSYDLTQIV